MGEAILNTIGEHAVVSAVIVLGIAASALILTHDIMEHGYSFNMNWANGFTLSPNSSVIHL